MLDPNPYADQLTIETPEQVDLHLPIAGVGSRFLALLIDSALQFVAYVLVVFLLYVAAGTHPLRPSGALTPNENRWFTALFILFNFVLFWGYFSLFEAFWHGQTPGKHFMKLRVIKHSGRSINLFEALARNLLRVVDFFPSLYLTGVIAMCCNKHHQRLGDLVAGTLVIHERLDEQPLLSHNSRTFTAAAFPQPTPTGDFLPDRSHAFLRPATEALPELPADAVARLTAQDLHVLETFFNRALDLTVERRAELAARVAQTLTAKMNLSLPEGANPERLLEQIAFRMRSHSRP